MIPATSSPDSRAARAWFWVATLGTALALRLYFFSGPSLFDDVNYWMQSLSTGLDGAWPPTNGHWQTRIGFVLPCALMIKIFGLKLWVPYTIPLLGGMLEVAVTYRIAREFVPEQTARLATWLVVFFPFSVLFSTYLYVDLWSGLLGALALFYWYRALKQERAQDYLLASALVGVGWLCRETVVMLAPVFLILWWHAGHWQRPKVLWALLPALLIVGGEMWMYQLTTLNWHYRLDTIIGSKQQLLEDMAGDDAFWLSPVKLLFTSHELGIFLLAALIVTVFTWRHLPKPLALWLLVGFVWFGWGTVSPTSWVTMQRDPRYLAVLTIPCMTLLTVWLHSLRSELARSASIVVLIASGLFGCALDAGHLKLTAHRKLVASEFNRPDVALEPNVYFGARAALNFAEAEAHFRCANDLGRINTTKAMVHFPGAQLTPSANVHYAVFSLETQPAKWKRKVAEGWREVTRFPAEQSTARHVTAQLLNYFTHYAAKSGEARGLIVLENPVFANHASLPLH